MEAMIKNATNKGITKVLRLNELISINFGKRITKDKDGNINGKYPVMVVEISYYTNSYNREGKTYKISRFGTSEKTCVIIINKRYYLNDAGFTINVNDENKKILKNEYLWNYLVLIKKSIYKTCRESTRRYWFRII